MLLESKQIVGGYVKETAQYFQVFYTGFILIIFQIRHLSLGHINCTTQFCLIQFPVFSKKSYLFAEAKFHIHHRLQFIIDAIFLFTFRQ